MSYGSRIGAVLFAQNLDRVATFYSVMLGLAESNRDDDHIVLESPGFQLVVHRITTGKSTAGSITVAPARRAAAAFKPVFFVPSISRLRGSAWRVMEAADHEWSFNGVRVCDGLDPEGNVIQFREHKAPQI
jgi:catechol 2,3-dioxygenase-like lactoylglutathione lyase family enzyme